MDILRFFLYLAGLTIVVHLVDRGIKVWEKTELAKQCQCAVE